MNINKAEIADIIGRLKSTTRKSTVKALEGILVKDGYFIAANAEHTLQIKSEAPGDDCFIIPPKAFELIKNLPDGDVTIEGIEVKDSFEVAIKIGKIKNRYQTFDPESFMYNRTDIKASGAVEISGEQLIRCLNNVVYAAADNDPKQKMNGVYLDGGDGYLNLVALDGHIMAWDRIEIPEADGMKLIVPKSVVKNLVSLGAPKNVKILYDKNFVVFQSDFYILRSRLIDGPYFQYKNMFREPEMKTEMDRRELLGAISRAKMCMSEQAPVIFTIEGKNLNIRLNDATVDYEEELNLFGDPGKPIRIGFSARLLLETIKVFTSNDIVLNLTNPVSPMIIESDSDDSNLKAMVLPVKIKTE